MSNVEVPPPPKSPDLKELRRRVFKEKKKVEDVNSKVPAVQLATLSQDASHIKLFVYGMAAVLLAALVAVWQLYLHIDSKIDSKVDYLNIRIDNTIQSNREIVSHIEKAFIDNSFSKSEKIDCYKNLEPNFDSSGNSSKKL